MNTSPVKSTRQAEEEAFQKSSNRSHKNNSNNDNNINEDDIQDRQNKIDLKKLYVYPKDPND